MGRLVSLAAYASSVLHNGRGQHHAACDAARLAFEREPMGLGSHIVPELAEAAARTGDVALVEAALEWLSERARVTPTEWVLGIEARARALLYDGDAAESFYRESIEGLARDGLSNPEIGARLFISARTVQYHLGKVFTKLGISSRSQLYRALAGDAQTTPSR